MEHRPNMYRVRRDRLVQSMADNEISGRSLAVLAGCSRSTTCDLWAGRRSSVSEPIAIGIAAALEYELAELFDVEDRVAWQRGTLASSA
jgi:transcriptional regulator with XRE-family HTH domain